MHRTAVLLILALSGSAPAGDSWEPVGLSGGGAMFSPAISPADPNRMMVHCDMGAAYLTSDGGRTWRMIPTTQLRSNTRCRPVFHPKDRNVIYSPEGRTIKVTRDGGERWTALSTLSAAPRGEVAVDPANPDVMFAGAEDGAFRSLDGGRTWKRCDGVKGAAVSFFVEPKRGWYVATEEGVWRSDDGAAYTEKCKGLPWRGLRGFAGASSAAEKRTILYCTIPSRETDGGFAGGIYRSLDRGETWESAVGKGLNVETKAFDQWAMGPVAQYYDVLAAGGRPGTVWAFNSNTGVPPPHHTAAYRSDDAGRTWRATFHPDPRYRPFNVEHDYTTTTVNQFYQDLPMAAINPADPDHVMQVDGGRCYVTRDGGKTWTAAHTRLAPGLKTPGRDLDWLCNGLVVTTTWNYYVDPFEPHRHYIAYTDIGFARSLDAGKTWRWWALEGRAPWGNTCYELAFDPQTPGKVWGAFSNVHDIPNGNIILNRHRSEGAGGICVSTDFAATWKSLQGGLPAAPATSVALDPRSPRGARTLYAGFFGRGVYKSADDGKTWVAKNKGLGAAENLRVCRVAVHADGTLFALVTARVEGRTFRPEGVGLYRSSNGGDSWECVTRSRPLLWPKDFTVDPKDSRVVYLGAADANGNEEGGLYRTADGGAAWKRLAREGPEHFGAYLHPKRPGWIYMTLTEGAPGAGLWLSKDGGATFAAIKGMPFNNAMRVAFDPKNEGTIYVTTFGGSVWRGPAE
ncbi:MAG: hypothetical protein HYY17_01845 [Planctomycetes bacterium]|nr:hypothetical protein [Planctomycetota bacterium]